jgi:predicted  nucleic acid-binding Zn-ribbon protein
MVDSSGQDPEALRAEVLEARHRLLVHRDHVIGTEAEVGRLNRDILLLQSELNGSRKKIRALQKRKSGLMSRNADLQAKLAAARGTTRQLRAELEREREARVPLSRRVLRRLRGGRP